MDLRATGTPLAPWRPGAHIDLMLPNWLTRQYSLCGDPAQPDGCTWSDFGRWPRNSRRERAFEVLFARASRMYPCVSRARLVVDL